MPELTEGQRTAQTILARLRDTVRLSKNTVHDAEFGNDGMSRSPQADIKYEFDSIAESKAEDCSNPSIPHSFGFPYEAISVAS
jgi:hypothetical protein